jgi:protocatechuate 3,4-dioxygenase beta subunit
MTNFLKMTLLILLLNSHEAIARNKMFINSLNKCIPTKNIMDNYEPLNFNLTNNLITSSKLSEDSKEIKKVLIFGKLLDKNCIPIANASIYAWQVGPDGKYHYKPLRENAVNKSLFSNNSNSFLGNATTTTDNNGNFVLIATNPKRSSSATSHGINIRAEHKDLGKVQTRFELLPFYKQVRSIKYPSFYKSDMDDKVSAYNLKLVMPCNVKFLRY